MHQNIEKNIQRLKAHFQDVRTPEEKYERIIAMGRELPPLPPEHLIHSNLVQGCQSTTYLLVTLNDNHISLQATSDALISAGLMAILIWVFQGQSPQDILTTPTSFLQEIGLEESISPNRVNGLFAAYQMLRQKALAFLMKTQNTQD